MPLVAGGAWQSSPRHAARLGRVQGSARSSGLDPGVREDKGRSGQGPGIPMGSHLVEEPREPEGLAFPWSNKTKIKRILNVHDSAAFSELHIRAGFHHKVLSIMPAKHLL